LGFVIFLLKNIDPKAAHKMLMKLITDMMDQQMNQQMSLMSQFPQTSG